MGYSRIGSVQSGGIPRRTAPRSLGSLGDDSEMSDLEWRRRMLEEQTAVRKWQEHWVKRDEFQRWLQLGATLSIPLAAAVWRLILGRRRSADIG